MICNGAETLGLGLQESSDGETTSFGALEVPVPRLGRGGAVAVLNNNPPRQIAANPLTAAMNKKKLERLLINLYSSDVACRQVACPFSYFTLINNFIYLLFVK